MPTRVVVGLHVAWMAIVVGLALWGGWLWKLAPARDGQADCMVRKGEPFSIVPAPGGGAFDDLIPKRNEP